MQRKLLGIPVTPENADTPLRHRLTQPTQAKPAPQPMKSPLGAPNVSSTCQVATQKRFVAETHASPSKTCPAHASIKHNTLIAAKLMRTGTLPDELPCFCSAAFRQSVLLLKLAHLGRHIIQTQQQGCTPLSPPLTAQAAPLHLALLRSSPHRGNAQDMWYAIYTLNYTHIALAITLHSHAHWHPLVL